MAADLFVSSLFFVRHSREGGNDGEKMQKKSKKQLTHIDQAGRPTMVDVSDKATSVREASAECRVRFPAGVAEELRSNGLQSKKGGIVETAIIAGTMAVKRTHELIPFCHPLPIDGCKLQIDWLDENALRIECMVKTTHRTGVEMEALTGATVAALTVYDMCKALSHAIVIGPAKLLGQTRWQARLWKSRMTTVTVLYFASLRDAAGVSSEVVQTNATDLRALYVELQSRHGFALAIDRLRVAVGGAFVSWDDAVHSGNEVAFIPPVSGG